MEGSDTASSSLQVIVLALTRYPEVQKKAQEEMDRVVGSDRMPDEHDIQDLKYMQAIIEEVSDNHFGS
jgi:cytochrome P450